MFQQKHVKKIGTFGWGFLLFLFLCVLPMAVAQNETEKPNTAETGYATPGDQGVSGFTHLVTFQAKGDFVPRNPRDYLTVSHAHPDSNKVYRGYFRTKIENGKLIASNLTNDPDAMRKMIESTPQFEYVKTERLTKEMFDAYEKTPQESLPPTDGGYVTPQGGFTYLVTFQAKSDFVPKTPMDYLGLINPKLNKFGVHAGYFRSKTVEGKLIAMNLTTTPDEYKKLVDSIPQFKYVKTERLTKEMFDAYEKTPQESLSQPSAVKNLPVGKKRTRTKTAR